MRLQGGDSDVPPRPPLSMPSPQEFGLGAKSRLVEVNWTAVRDRMTALQVSSFHLQKLEGGFRFICVVPVRGERLQIEADGVSEAEAIDLALGRAESRR